MTRKTEAERVQAFLSEGFSGKRPLGNSGWEINLDEALKRHGVTREQVLDGLFAREE